MLPLLCSAYLPPVSFFQAVSGATEVCIERYDNYHKQTFRNRCVIATADGTQSLSVPVVKSDYPKQLMRDVRISDHGNWRHLHWNAIASAYMNSPFFMYYEDDFRPIYDRHHTFLVDFNQELMEKIVELAGLDIALSMSDEYRHSADDDSVYDLRRLVDPSAETGMTFAPYYQVFRQKNGFQKNLSIVDMLFNLGPETAIFLSPNRVARV